MKTVTMLEFRKNALAIIRSAMRGQRVVLTYRGKPVLKLEPVDANNEPVQEDPFYALATLADEQADGMTNDEMDRVVYED
ncbi:MAG: hypothetical protein ABI333_07345 [bacterium]